MKPSRKKYIALGVITTLAIFLLSVVIANRFDIEAPNASNKGERTNASQPVKTKKTEASDSGQFAGLNPTEWVTQYAPELASNGYTLALLVRKIPVLFDMNGRIVHSWPKESVVGRARLLPDGTLLSISREDTIREVAWDGELLWEYKVKATDLPHHDVIRLQNGNNLFLVRENRHMTCYLLEVDRDGEVVFRWDSFDYLDRYFKGRVENANDPTHFNSVQELPSNKWYDRGDQRFRPGNLLVSARHLNTVFIIEKRTKEVVWQMSDGLDYQHEALMIEKGRPHEGNILIFNNGTRGRFAEKRSDIIEIDPTNLETKWQYGSPYFYSESAGVQQALRNGNIMIASSHGGRVFEVNREGRIVWQWIPPYLPMRPSRVAYDHCPQLAGLPRPAEKPIPNRIDSPFISKNQYHLFRAKEDTWVLKMQGTTPSGPNDKEKASEVRVLKETVFQGSNDKVCKRIRVPFEATLVFQYGLYKKNRLRTLAPASTGVEFVVSLTGHSDKQLKLWSDTLRWTQKTVLKRIRLPLNHRVGEMATLCFETKVVEGSSADSLHKITYWGEPKIKTPPLYTFDKKALNEIKKAKTQNEMILLKRQLQVLGYVE